MLLLGLLLLEAAVFAPIRSAKSSIVIWHKGVVLALVFCLCGGANLIFGVHAARLLVPRPGEPKFPQYVIYTLLVALGAASAFWLSDYLRAHGYAHAPPRAR